MWTVCTRTTPSAVSGGLSLLQQARAQAEAVQRRFGRSGFEVRVGISSGSVLMGGGVNGDGDGDGTIRGHTVNMAARMEQTAPVGALRISQDNWALVRGAFEAEAQAPLTVKGHDEPVATWLVKAARPRALRLPGRGIAGVETPLAGRLHGLQRFNATVRALLADRQPAR